MKHANRRLCLLILTLSIATACVAGAEVVNQIVAVVDDEIITLYEIEKEATQLMLALRQQNRWTAEQAAEYAPGIKKDILQNKIREKLFEHEIAKLGIPVSEKDIDEYVDYMLQRSKLTQEQLREMLRREGTTTLEYREMVKKRIQREQYVQFRVQKGSLEISDEEIRNYYNLHAGDFLQEPEVKLREIRLHLPGDATDDDESALAREAQSLYQELLAGAPFADMAKKHSDSGSAESGGDIGWFKLNTELKAAYSRAAETLQAGQISAPEKDGKNWFVLKMEERTTSDPKALEDVRDQIQTILYNKEVDLQMEALTDELYQKSYVDVRVDSFE